MTTRRTLSIPGTSLLLFEELMQRDWNFSNARLGNLGDNEQTKEL
jgi:hypothetical protein